MSGKVYTGRKGNKTSSTTHKRSKMSNRRPLNRYQLEGDSEHVSTSAKKLKTADVDQNREVDNNFGYTLINFYVVFTALSHLLVCKQCNGDVRFSETSKRGLGFKLTVSCVNCGDSLIDSCPLINDRAYEVNSRIVFAMRVIGIGINGIRKFCAMMDLATPVLRSTYYKIIDNIVTATSSVRASCMKKAAIEEKKVSVEREKIDGLTVSGDGSWRKRGFSSLFGLVTLIGWHTGKVLDVCVKSKYCKVCEYWKKKEGTVEYEEAYPSHKEHCDVNHEGSAGKMEVDAVVEMFKRSEELHNTKYLQYIGDGDSKTYKGIVDARPYEDVVVQKKECIGHVQKRMGTRLRNLKKTKKGLGGRGKLTGKLIDELSIFYGLAIRRNSSSIEEMRNGIWATLDHKLSTDENPKHDKCPVGVGSWCSWQSSKALGTLSIYEHKSPMSMEVYEAIKPIYEELSSDNLLSRCLGGYTQNSNESLNAVVWSIAPKSVSSGKTILDIATDVAVITFNDGFSSLPAVYDVLGIVVGPNMLEFCLEVDSNRIEAAEHSMSDFAKEARRSSTSSKKDEEEHNKTIEGQLYGAGIAE